MEIDSATQEEIREASKIYWSIRDSLLPAYDGRWVVLVGTMVVGDGEDPLQATLDAGRKGVKKGFLQRVGYEDRTEFRVRHRTFPYDSSYAPFPIPGAQVIVRNVSETRNRTVDDIVLDTGSDLTSIAESVCKALELESEGKYEFMTAAYGKPPEMSIFYNAIIEIDGRKYFTLVEEVPDSQEELMGRDVLNKLKVTFDGPNKQTIID